jgi:quercetin dioxygenase-like cupin family protein
MDSTHSAPKKPETRPAHQLAPVRQMSAARLEIKAGSATPIHRHDAECIVVVLQGSCRFYIAGQTLTVRESETLGIPAQVDHCSEALTDTVAVNIFSSAKHCVLCRASAYRDPDQDLWGV